MPSTSADPSASSPRSGRTAQTFLAVAVLVALALALGAMAATRGWLTPFGIGEDGSDQQVVTAVQRTQEVSLLSLGVQGIKEESRDREVFGRSVPGTSQRVFLQYSFRAKLGLDGSKVKVEKTGDHAYRLTIPEYTFIGYDEPTFKVAAKDEGVLSWVTPEIDQAAMVDEILNSNARAEYLRQHEGELQDQTKVFYDSVVKGVDPDATTTYEFEGGAPGE